MMQVLPPFYNEFQNRDRSRNTFSDDEKNTIYSDMKEKGVVGHPEFQNERYDENWWTNVCLANTMNAPWSYAVTGTTPSAEVLEIFRSTL